MLTKRPCLIMKSKTAKLIIAVDIDDVLFPTNEEIRRYVNENFGANLSEEDHAQPGEYKGYFERVWGVDHERAEHWYQSFIRSGALVEMQPIEGAIEVIAYLEKYYELVVVSARHEDQVEMTHNWLLKHFPRVFRDVKFISGWYHGRKISKAEVCKEIGASYLIDDNVEHCIQAEKVGLKTLLFSEYGWSKQNPQAVNLTRVNDWFEIKKFFENETHKQPA